MGKISVLQSDRGVSSLSGEKWVGPEEGLGEEVLGARPGGAPPSLVANAQ